MQHKILLLLLLLSLCVSTIAQTTIEEVSVLPESVSNNAVCEGFNNDTAYVFSFGGIDTSKLYSGIHLRSYRYNVQTGETIQIPDLPDSLGKIAAAASRIGNIIYISGGYHVFQNERELSSNKMHRYDILNNAYLPDGQDIPVPTDDHVQAVWKDSLIYLITGWSNNGNIPDVQIYNPTSDSWLVGTPTPNTNTYKSFGASGTIVNDTIYYFGGAASSAGFRVQNQLRKGVINSFDPTQIDWSVTTPDRNINGYRMAALHSFDRLYWIGGSNVTYNYNGIAYNGTGGVETSNRILQTEIDNIEWRETFTNLIPMDLRGVAEISESIKYIAGGMIDDQIVTDKIYKITLDSSSISAIPTTSTTQELNAYPNPFNNSIEINSSSNGTITIYNTAGNKIAEQQLKSGLNHIDTQSFSKGLYFTKTILNSEVQSAQLIIKN